MSKLTSKRILRDLNPEEVTYTDFLTCFKDHVYGGFALNGNSDKTKELIEALDLTSEQKSEVKRTADFGIKHWRKRNKTATREYISIARLLA